MVARRRITPEPLLNPVGRIKKRIILRGCPWLKPDSPQTIDGTQLRRRCAIVVIPQKLAMPRGAIGHQCDYGQNQAKEPIAFRPTHEPTFIAKSFVGLGTLQSQVVSALSLALRGHLH